ncbi:hypothetical protein [Halosegnis marinus]|uniref:CARDB protein n=1 Tax=Halosegnis marinus TaxID=3034023 RepID=A0ABD5ZPV1_9EURY|nr:hypothetical protein [Halosegnis sp. DT85]
MTNRRTVLLVALAVALASTMAGAALTGAATQENTQHTGDSFRVDALDAPMVAVQGDTITVTATVSYPGNATDGTATPTGTETETNGTDTATETDTTETEANGTETETETNATETETNATETETNATETETNATETETNATATDGDTDTAAEESDAVTQSVAFRVGGDVVERQSVTLAPGESANVSFEVDTGALSPGVYIHGVYTDDFGEVATLIVTTTNGNATDNGTETPTDNETDNGTATPTDNGTATPDTPVTTATDTPAEGTETPTATAAPEEPSLDVRNLTAPDSVTVGETVEVSAEVFYPPDPTGEDGNVTQRVDFRLNGDVVAERNVTLAPGESTNVTFGVDSSGIEPGVYIHSVFTRDYGEVATLTVLPADNDTATPTEGTETPTEETETPTEETETPTGNATDTATENGTATPTDSPTEGTATENETATDTATPTAAETDTATA